MSRTLCQGAAAAVAAVGTFFVAPVHAAEFYEAARVDLRATTGLDILNSTTGIGTNPFSVAWNGTDLFVGGAGTTPAIAKINNVYDAPAVTSVFGRASNGGSGYGNLDVQGNHIAAATVNNGTNGRLYHYNLSGTEVWAAQPSSFGTAARFDGAAVDPGFGGTLNVSDGAGIGALTRGSGRRLLANFASPLTVTGDTSNGIIVFGTSSTWRDLDFDAETGDIYARSAAGGVVRGIRSGAGTVVKGDGTAGVDTVVAFADTEAVGLNVAVLNDFGGADLLILNDRQSSATDFATAQKLYTAGGTAQTATFLNGDGSAPFATGQTTTGIFDYSWDEASQTLAVSDYDAGLVYIFQSSPVPEPASFGVLAAAGGLLALRRRRRA